MSATRASLLSPVGCGGVAVVQIVGPGVAEITRRWLRTRRGRPAGPLDDQRLRLLKWVDGGETIDDVIVAAGRSTSGEPTLCITPHGSVGVVERILSGLRREGVQIVPLAPQDIWSGLHGVEAAVMADLPRARTRRVAEWLLRQIEALPEAIRRCCACIDAGEHAAAAEILERLAATFTRSRIPLDGGRVAIIGLPNAGKSTLANRLFDRPFSVESPIPGTTRDWVERPISVGGIPLTLTDTAGLRAAPDPLEAAAVEAARPLILSSDVQIVVVDGTDPAHGLPAGGWSEWLLQDRLLIAVNKCDLGVRGDAELGLSNDHPVVRTSALLGTGLDALRAAVLAVLERPGALTPVPGLWRDDQRNTVHAALAALPTDAVEAAAQLRSFFAPGAEDFKIL